MGNCFAVLIVLFGSFLLVSIVIISVWALFVEQAADEVSSLKQIVAIVTDSDMSPFEIIHSGLVGALLLHLTVADVTVRNNRLCKFLQAFLSLPVRKACSSSV